MNTLVIVLIAAVCLLAGYALYGRWLAKKWGIDPTAETPAVRHNDGEDYVPTNGWTVFAHQFSSIAGAGPVTGAIQAAAFGWLPVLLWILLGGIFFGAVHDFGALFASIRHKGRTLAMVIQRNIDDTAKKLFCVFAYLTLLLVVAAFASIVASTFAITPVPVDDQTRAAVVAGTNVANSRTAMISILFVVVAIIYGIVTRGRKIPAAANIISAIAIIIAVVAIG